MCLRHLKNAVYKLKEIASTAALRSNMGLLNSLLSIYMKDLKETYSNHLYLNYRITLMPSMHYAVLGVKRPLMGFGKTG